MAVTALEALDPVPADAGCVVCGRDRRPDRSRRYARGAAELDPFCSRNCCEAHYGIDGHHMPDPDYDPPA